MKTRFFVGVMAIAGLAGASMHGMAGEENSEPGGLRGGGAASGKLINAEDIMAGFEGGQNKVKVIVNLAQPLLLLAVTDWNAADSVAAFQQAIAAIDAPVLAALNKDDFTLGCRFKNQAGFAGEVTKKGLEQLENDPRVVSVEPDYIEEVNLAQGIPLMNGSFYRPTYNGTGVAIAICDTGIDYTHPRLGGGGFPNAKVIGGYDTGDDDGDPMTNGHPHGTACAGIAAGDLGTMGDYIGGVAHNARLYALKISFGAGGSAYISDIVEAWDWCVTHKNDDPANPILVISTSFGGGRYFAACDASQTAYANAANAAVAAGITLFASSGNSGYCDSIGRSACVSNVISVGAVYDAAFGTYYPCVSVDSCATKYSTTGCSTGYYAIDNTAPDMVTSYSNTATFLDLFAPSNQAYTTDIVGSTGYSAGDYYCCFGGTSAACPYAAGAAACLQEAAMACTSSYLTPAVVRTTLTSTGDLVTDGKVAITKPRVNLDDAIEDLCGPAPCCPTTISSYPYAEGFESGLGDWVNVGGDDIDWTRNSGSTSSSGTGPSSAHGGSYYLYTEASGSGYPNKTAILEGPCFDLNLLCQPFLTFWYHMYGSSMGTLSVEVSDDDCASWSPVWALSGDQGNTWNEAVVDLSSYSGTIKVRFKGVTGSSFTSDMAIDDVSVVGGYSLELTERHPTWGDVGIVDPNDPNDMRIVDPNDPNTVCFPPGTAVTLCALPVGNKQLSRWRIFDPNFPDDANYATNDSNECTTILMNSDMHVHAAWKCGSGVEQELPLLVIGAAICSLAHRRMRRRE